MSFAHRAVHFLPQRESSILTRLEIKLENALMNSSSISWATVTPSLVMRGAPNDLSSKTLRSSGPSVTFTAFIENFDAAQRAISGIDAEFDFFG
jgi:hypothetical protein